MELFQNCILVTNEIRFACDPKIAKITFNLQNDGIHDSIANATIELFKQVEKLLITGVVSMPAFERDDKYQLILVKSVTDVDKLFKGFYGNFVTRTIMESFKNSIDFELKLPFKKRAYIITNFTASDKYVPLFVSTKFKTDFRAAGTVSGSSSRIFFCNFTSLGEIKKITLGNI